MKSGYELLVRPLLFSLDAETAHHFTVALLGRASHFDAALQLLRFFLTTPKPVSLFGLTFPNPIGLAAGLDKTVLLFLPGQRSGLVLSRLEPSLQKRSLEI